MAVKEASQHAGLAVSIAKKNLTRDGFFFARHAGTKLSLLQPSSSSVIVFLVSALASAE